MNPAMRALTAAELETVAGGWCGTIAPGPIVPVLGNPPPVPWHIRIISVLEPEPTPWRLPGAGIRPGG